MNHHPSGTCCYQNVHGAIHEGKCICYCHSGYVQPLVASGAKEVYLGFGNNCEKCNKSYCTCPERQPDKSWKELTHKEPISGEWEDFFDKEFPFLQGVYKENAPAMRESVKEYFRNVLAQTLSAERERVLGLIERMKWPEPPRYPNDPVGDDTWKNWYYHELVVKKVATAITKPNN